MNYCKILHIIRTILTYNCMSEKECVLYTTNNFFKNYQNVIIACMVPTVVNKLYQ